MAAPLVHVELGAEPEGHCWYGQVRSVRIPSRDSYLTSHLSTLRMERRRRATASAPNVIAQPRPQVDHAWEANEITLQKKYNTGPQGTGETDRDYHRRIVFNSVAKDIGTLMFACQLAYFLMTTSARIIFIDHGLPPSAMRTWKRNAMTIFYKYGLELRGWFRGWEHACPGYPDATRAALNPTTDEWKRAAAARALRTLHMILRGLVGGDPGERTWQQISGLEVVSLGRRS